MSLRKNHQQARRQGKTPNAQKAKRASDSIKQRQYEVDERIAIQQEGCNEPIDVVKR